MNRLARAAVLLWTVLASMLALQPGNNPSSTAANSGDFFIISSVDLAKKQLLLKLPTEVTELMRVEDQTGYYDENGKRMKLSDLRAGDTVFITSSSSTTGHVALAIRKGPMTLQLLRERYLSGKK